MMLIMFILKPFFQYPCFYINTNVFVANFNSSHYIFPTGNCCDNRKKQNVKPTQSSPV